MSTWFGKYGTIQRYPSSDEECAAITFEIWSTRGS